MRFKKYDDTLVITYGSRDKNWREFTDWWRGTMDVAPILGYDDGKIARRLSDGAKPAKPRNYFLSAIIKLALGTISLTYDRREHAEPRNQPRRAIYKLAEKLYELSDALSTRKHWRNFPTVVINYQPGRIQTDDGRRVFPGYRHEFNGVDEWEKIENEFDIVHRAIGGTDPDTARRFADWRIEQQFNDGNE